MRHKKTTQCNTAGFVFLHMQQPNKKYSKATKQLLGLTLNKKDQVKKHSTVWSCITQKKDKMLFRH